MKAEIITIGDEILIGQIIDTNSAYLAKKLNNIGISVYQITSIQDEKTHILNALEAAFERVNIIIITGGLGPTKDDITKKCLCQYFGTKLVEDKETLKHVQSFFEKRNRPFLKLNRKQADIPKNAKILSNKLGTAPGMWFEKEGRVFISMPGVPMEMKYITETHLLKKLPEYFELPHIVHKTIYVYGLPESFLAKKIETWENHLPKTIKLAYLPNPEFVRLRFSSRGNNKKAIEDMIQKQIETLKNIIGNYIKGKACESAEEAIASKLISQNCSLSISESCTGGGLTQRFTSMPGASKYFVGALIPYETSKKEKILGISSKIIEKHSVVSEIVVKEMALKTQKLFGSDYAVATTGNAGPSKGNSEEKVGTVFIAVATSKGVVSQKHFFVGSREIVIKKTIGNALNLLMEQLHITS